MKKSISITCILLVLISSIVFAFHNSNNTYALVTVEQTELLQDTDFNYGKALFKENCKGCHKENMMQRSTGPVLGGITKKRNKKWLYEFTKNSQKMYVEGDSLAIAIGDEYFGLMPAFPALSDSDLDKIYYYVEKRYGMSLQGIPVPVEFEFRKEENNNATACTHILIEKSDILNVSVTKDRQWTFSCKRSLHKASEWKKTTLMELFEYDNSINGIKWLTDEFPVFRSSKNAAWDYKL